MPKVNKDFVKELLDTKAGKKGNVDVETLIKDDRFGKMFTDKEF